MKEEKKGSEWAEGLLTTPLGRDGRREGGMEIWKGGMKGRRGPGRRE